MITFILSIIAGVVTGLILAAFPSIRARLGQFKDLLPRLLSSTPKVAEFAKRLDKASFGKFPSGEARFSYYVRRHKKIDQGNVAEKKDELYHFFTRSDVVIDRFMAFLIPPLDRGHGRREAPEHSGGLYLNEDWNRYLHEIDKRAPKKGHDGEPRARRIVFFDRMKLMLLIFQTEWVMRTAQVIDKKLKTIDDVDPLTRSAREIVQYALDIALMHQRIFEGETIECRYAAKSAVAASEYYDFGLYEIEGVDIVYTPIYYKDDIKALAIEKVFIGNTKPQRLGIADFVSDFNALWERVEDGCADQKTNHQFNDLLSKGSSDAYFARIEFLRPKFFEEIYCKAIRRILLSEMDIDITKLSLFPA